MNELIWYSIPGAVVTYVIYLFFPGLLHETTGDKGGAIAGVLATPIFGFVAHQFFRTLFEAFRIWERPCCRSVLRHISVKYKPSDKDHGSFLIWDLTFYSQVFPQSLKDHQRSMWHFTLSFWSVAFTSLLGLGALVVARLCGWTFDDSLCWPLCILVFLVALFTSKGFLTYQQLMREELETFRIYEKLFEATAKGQPPETNE